MDKNVNKDALPSYLFHQGTNYYAYEYMGFHYEKDDNNKKIAVFRTWAPNAKEVYLAGDFTDWNIGVPMTRITDGGIYSVSLPAKQVHIGHKYKYRIITHDGRELYKADPYAFYAEKPPLTASVIADCSFKWNDGAYMRRRKKNMSLHEYDLPINIYEVHLGSWKRHEDGSLLSYSELSAELIPYLKQMGYTHIELMPIAEHPFDGSWGYQVTGFYAPTSRYGTPSEFKQFVCDFHNAGLGVILDWVPAHFPKDAHGLYEFDGQPLYEFQGADRMEHAGWGTRKFDIARNEVESFLISNAVYWLKEYHVDGLRVDAVASMLYLDYDKKPGEWNPNIYGGNESLEAIAFFKKLNAYIESSFLDILMIAEESTAFAAVTKPVSEGGLGFNYKWNMGWMNDTLSYAQTEFDYRPQFHNKTNFSLMYSFSERYVLPISHDEVVHGKLSLIDRMPGDYWRKFAGSRLFLSYMYLHPGKKLLFMGSEIGQFREWDYEGSIEWFLLGYEKHKQLQLFVRDLNKFYLDHSQLWHDDHDWRGFEWLRTDDAYNSVSSFMRKDSSLGQGRELIAVINYGYEARAGFEIKVPYDGVYKEIFSSDDKKYGGGGFINADELRSCFHDGEHFIKINLPPIGVSVFEIPRTNKDNINKGAKISV